MAVEALGVFLVVTEVKPNGSETVRYRFHNAPKKGADGTPVNNYRTTLIEGSNYQYNYIPFIYQGGTQNRSGDNITAGIGLAPNEISMAFATDVTETVSNNSNEPERYPMTVRAVTTSLNPDTFELNGIITDETWLAAGMTYNAELLEIVLSSAIDAVNALAPSYTLSRFNVGRLPVSSNVRV